MDNKYDGYQGGPIDYRHIDHVREVAQDVRHEKRKRKSPLKKIRHTKKNQVKVTHLEKSFLSFLSFLYEHPSVIMQTQKNKNTRYVSHPP